MRVLTPQKIHLHFRMLSSPDTASGVLNINCCDPLGRSALLMAIDNENLEMVELLLENKVSKRVLIGFSKEKKNLTLSPNFQQLILNVNKLPTQPAAAHGSSNLSLS